MDRQRRGPKQQSPEETASDIAGRLDRLNAEQAEGVIRRAIQLTDAEEERFEYGTMDAETLERVAGELGIPARHVRRAMAEQRANVDTTHEESSLFDRLFGITDFDEAAIIEGSRADVEQAIGTWMTSHEGLRRQRSSADGATWTKDDRPMTAIRMGLGLTNGSKSLRSAGEINHSIRTIAPAEHLVSLTASKSRLRLAASLWSAGVGLFTILALAFGVGADQLVAGIGAALATAAVGAGVVVAGVRSWAKKIRMAVDRAVDAIADPAQSGVFETLPGRLGSFLRSIGVSASQWRTHRRD